MEKSFQQLLQQYLSDELSAPEMDRFFALLEQPEHQAALEADISLQWKEATPAPDNAAAVHRLRTAIQQTGPVKVRRIPRWWAAAAVLMVIAAAAWFWTYNNQRSAAPLIVAQSVNVAPGKAGAVLTLSDGSEIVLDSLGNGVVAVQNGAQVVLQNNGLTYAPGANSGTQIAYNTMTTPKGRQFQLMLPDGSRVWLNAASSITFPTIFNGKERNVKVSGEAYFEVVKHAAMPFTVSVQDQATVTVLGTSFNVNAYTDEDNITTTLLEGAIRTSRGGASVILKPGQQAGIVRDQTGISVKERADIDKIIAWKNGLFNFQGQTLGEVMRQLERWYDIRVQYKESGQQLVFGGEMYRNVNLKDVLDMFKDMGVKYEWDGNTLTIL